MSLAIQNSQLILRSADGQGDNNNKSFSVSWSSILLNTHTQWRVHSRFVSKTGQFSGVSAEVKWSLTANNQTDSGGTGRTLSFPVIHQDVALDGSLVGSFMMNDFPESLHLFINTPRSSTLRISIHDMDDNLIANMEAWVLCLIFEPVKKR